MSYILDALKKSERERTLVRGVGFSDAGRRLVPQSRWKPWAVIALGSAAGVVAIVLSVLTIRGYIGNTPATAAKPNEISSMPMSAPMNTSNVSAAAAPPLLPSDGEAKRLVDMSPEFQQGVPAMQVNIHVYSPDESQRILYINNRQVRRGDDVGGGVRVEEIVPDGVVLQYQGRRFKLPRPT